MQGVRKKRNEYERVILGSIYRVCYYASNYPKKKGIMESKKRSIIKALTWRIIASITTGFIVYIGGKQYLGLDMPLFATGVGLTDVIIKLVLYFAHERGWNLIKWGYNS